MTDLICKAIEEVRALGFLYKGVQRWVEPHTYGAQANGKDGVCAWQLSGGSGEGYRLFLKDEISDLSLGEPFGGPRPGYRRGDRRFEIIYAEL